MTYESTDVRDAYHKLKTQTQVVVHTMWQQFLAQGYFLHVADVRGEDISLRLSRKPETRLTFEDDSL